MKKKTIIIFTSIFLSFYNFVLAYSIDNIFNLPSPKTKIHANTFPDNISLNFIHTKNDPPVNRTTTLIVGTNTRHLMGDITEEVMDNFFQGQGKWQKIDAQVGKNGIDGLYIRQMKNGRVKVLVVEAKYNTSQLNQTSAKGAQASKEWIDNSIDERIKSLEKKRLRIHDIEGQKQLDKEIQQLETIKKNGSYIRRVFTAEIQNSKMIISLTDIEEYMDSNGKLRTKKASITEDGATKKGSGLWKIDKGGSQRLEIPLSNEEYKKIISTNKTSFRKKKLLLNLRNHYFDTIKKSLIENGIHADDAKLIIDEIRSGNIKSSRELNAAVDKIMLSSEKTLLKKLSILGFTGTQTTALIKLSKTNLPGKKYIIEKVISAQQTIQTAKKITKKTYSALKNIKQTSKQVYTSIKRLDRSSIKNFLVQTNTYKNLGRSTFRGVVAITVVIEIFENLQFWQNYSRGYHTKQEAYAFTGKTLGTISFAAIGAKVGAKAGAAIGSLLPGPGTAIGIVVGGIGGAFTGCFVGSKTGDFLGNRTYSIFNDLKEEKYRKEYIVELMNYCNSESFKI